MQKVSSTFLSGVTQTSELGPVLLKIIIIFLFLFLEIKLARVTDENTIHAENRNPTSLINLQEKPQKSVTGLDIEIDNKLNFENPIYQDL